ncbi:uncharacterized protein LOC106643584 isoform X2 [Copidosoma floridanum]|uniref:uncharacterized protein LOC106643584 isoform X2 n=2 Tax=Copidosoma floridanum TaxID=29053 RepID=UPI000C6FA177|nr:uncharacterized protein LOC106643584 isoform X2 [Copidosoma floridanum]
MATDAEESDTDEHEKPRPAKRQKILENQSEAELEPPDPENPEEVVIDEEEDRRSREKLRCWQTCQVIRGFIDNAINSAIENCSMSPSGTFQDPWYCLFRGNRIEDTAISAAIRNYGLIRSLDINSLVDEKAPNVPQSSETVQESAAAMSSEAMLTSLDKAGNSSEVESWLTSTYDSDHQQDFLDRAVAEAIKKKGLSALSVDYG